MEIIKAKNAGFCFGVKRAIDEAYKTLSSGNIKVYSIGPLIHNELVTNDLKDRGLIELNAVDDIEKLHDETVIIRTHGIEKNLYDILTKNNNHIIDLTCPFVKKIHNLVDEYSDKGYKIIVIGDKNHPEVKGIVSYAKTPIFVILNDDDIREVKIDPKDKVLILFQTTTNAVNGQKLVDILKELFYNYKLVNTICNATESRQQEVLDLAKICDVMLIIGSKTSSNTKKLFEIACANCKRTFLLNDKKDLLNIDIKDACKIGVSAGASTPEYLIEEIIDNARF